MAQIPNTGAIPSTKEGSAKRRFLTYSRVITAMVPNMASRYNPLYLAMVNFSVSLLLPRGIEPRLQDPESCVLSVKLWERERDEMKMYFHFARTIVPKAPLMGASEEQNQNILCSDFFRSTPSQAKLVRGYLNTRKIQHLVRLKKLAQGFACFDALDGFAKEVAHRDDFHFFSQRTIEVNGVRDKEFFNRRILNRFKS